MTRPLTECSPHSEDAPCPHPATCACRRGDGTCSVCDPIYRCEYCRRDVPKERENATFRFCSDECARLYNE